MTKTQSELEQEIRDILRNNITDIASGRNTLVEGEAHTYSDGTSSYSFDHSPVSAITSVTGTVGGAEHTFVWNTDYTNTSTGLAFTDSGTAPDDGTDISVDYYYGKNWITLGRVDGNIGFPYIIIDDLNEFTEVEYLDISQADQSLRAGIYVVAQTRSDLNTLSDQVRDIFHTNLDSLSFYHVRKDSSKKEEFEYEELPLRKGDRKKTIRGYLDDIVMEFWYKVDRS
jgi:hypothetical protein